jgi:hypothetical protein
MLVVSLPNLKFNKELNISLGDTYALCSGQQKYLFGIPSFYSLWDGSVSKAIGNTEQFLSQVLVYKSDDGP